MLGVFGYAFCSYGTKWTCVTYFCTVEIQASALNTKVETKRGVVTLYGKAGNEAELDLATKLANDVNGVKGVKNRMTVE